jgi:hypothetical protein
MVPDICAWVVTEVYLQKVEGGPYREGGDQCVTFFLAFLCTEPIRVALPNRLTSTINHRVLSLKTLSLFLTVIM